MNKKMLAVIVGVIVLLLIIVAVSRSGNDGAEVATNETNTTEVQGTQTQQQSMKELLASNKPQKCEYSRVETDGSSVKGVSYIANGKIRGDFTSTSNGQTVTGHSLIDGTTIYSWIDGQPTAFKMTMNAAATAPQGQQTVNLDEKLDYKCSSWSPNASSFALPAGVTFTDMSAFMNTQGGASVPQR